MAAHAVGPLQETLSSCAWLEPGTLAIVCGVQALPFHRSARGVVDDTPTAVHVVAALHDTPLSDALEPEEVGTRSNAQRVPFQISDHGRLSSR